MEMYNEIVKSSSGDHEGGIIYDSKNSDPNRRFVAQPYYSGRATDRRVRFFGCAPGIMHSRYIVTNLLKACIGTQATVGPHSLWQSDCGFPLV